MRCASCGFENRVGVRFCEECGALVEVTCPACGATIPPSRKFCGACGQALASMTTTAPTETSRDQDSSRSFLGGRPEAERRQLTVMFCDLVGSTELSARVDPEVLRDVVRSFQRVSATVIERFGGHIAQYLGDGLLVYFGYPVAHEDDAQRAVRAALGILAAIERLTTQLETERGLTLAARIGIHTGLVVVGAMGGGGRQEDLALGETPNVAARLQSIAEPGSVVLSAATQRLVGSAIQCRDLGPHSVKGLAEPLRVHQVVGERAAPTTLDVVSPSGVTPLVGREQEIGLLLGRWEQVKAGHGQVVQLSGEPGIGKSRLVRELRDRIAGEPHTRWECRGSAYHQDSALHPVIELFERALEFGRDESPASKLAKIASALRRYGLFRPDTVSLWTSLLSVPLPDDHAPLNLTPQRQKRKTFEAIVDLLLALAAAQPVLFIVEDLHWIDPSTRELLELVLEQVPTARTLLLLTCRPEVHPPWSNRAYLTHLTITRFMHRQTEAMVERLASGKQLPPEVLRQIVAKTDGVPLFVEELTKTVLDSELLQEREDRYQLRGALPPLAIPSTLHDSLMARLDRLASVKEVAQIGAALGRSFSYALLRAVTVMDQSTLDRGLARLVAAELLYQRGIPPSATYIFKHALIQDAAYQSMLISRRQQLHQHIAEVLAAQFAAMAETQPETLAHHYTEAGLATQAVEYWRRAGERAVGRSANVEAIAHLTSGLEVLKTVPDTPGRTEQELVLHAALLPPLWASKGFGAQEVEHTCSRLRDLCREAGETPRLLPALWGLGGFYCVRGEIRAGLEFHGQALSLAQRGQDTAALAMSHFLVGDLLFWFPDLSAARTHLDQGLALYEPERHRSRALVSFGYDVGIASLAFLSRVLWHQGYADQSKKCGDRALSIAAEFSHPLSECWALSWIAALYQLRREVGRVRELAEADVTLATEQVIPFFGAHGMVLRGWALVAEGHRAAGVAQLRDGLAAYRATGAELERSHWLACLAEACGTIGQPGEGLRVLDEALAEIERNEARYYEAELHRLRGELLLQQDAAAEHDAEMAFRRAIDIASRQQAKSFELRAAVSLGRLLQAQSKRESARRMLAEIHGWFTEGFDTADLKEAQALLGELSSS